MPPKSKKQKEIVQEERLQAIVLTDSFQTRFNPLTSVRPRCLLPLANVPLIEYTLEFLAKAGVCEVFLMCCSHADQIQQYIENSKWSKALSPFKISTIMSLESRSVGDSIRDLDNRGLITGDFVLVSGDVVTNIDFDKALQVHKQRKALDKDHIATMVLAKASPLHRTRSQVDPATFILDKKTNRCIYYQDIPPINGSKSFVSIDPELLENVDEFVIRNDLIDCCVDICTPHVPVIFQENFDYQFLRSDFVKGVLTSDLLGKTIYAYITTEYAARVESWQTYDAISQDILARWAYPIVPDSNLLEDQTYSYESKHIYKENNVLLAQSCKIGSCTMIGSNSSVGDASHIVNSVIGRNCKIGKNVTIKNSYIWDNSIIMDNCSIDYSIVASNSKILSNVKLNSGSVTGFNVVIGENVVIPSNTRIIEKPINKINNFDDSSDEESITNSDFSSNIKNDSSIVGEGGVGFLYQSDQEDDEDDDEISSKHYSGIIYQMKSLNISDDSIISTTTKKKRRTYSTTSIATDIASEEEEEDFHYEAVATVERAMEHNHDTDTALLELNTLRMSMNVTYHEVREATVAALLNRVIHFVNTKTLDLKAAVNKIFNQWGLLFKRQVFEPLEEVDLLNIIQRACVTVNDGNKILFFIVNILYDKEIIEEDNIHAWWASEESSASPEMVKVRDLTAKFIEWLSNAEEDDEDEEESGEESD